MSELQNEESTDTLTLNTPETVSENPDEGSDLATDTGENQEQNQVSEEDKQAKVTAAFNKQYGATKQAERERDAANLEIERLKQSQIQIPPQIGEFPNEFEFDTTEEFNQAKASFLDNVRDNATHEAQQQAFQNQQVAAQQVAQQQKAQKVQEDLISYTENAKKLGIDNQELQQAGNIVASCGMSEDLTLAILSDSDGPLITKYLAGNPVELDSLSRMNPFQAAMHIEKVLRPKAVVLKPKTSNTPDPATNLQGGGVDPEGGKYTHIKGAKFE